MDREYILHLLRVAKLTRSFCNLYYDNVAMANVGFMCGFLHDMGKLEVDQEILNKKNKLNSKEFEEIKKHSLYSYELLKEAGLNDYSTIALYHHEKYNGKGYPTGIKGNEIPLMSRIVALCDVFDAMTSKREYRNNIISTEDTLKYIKDNIGKHFDPHLAKYFIDNLENILLENELEDYIIA